MKKLEYDPKTESVKVGPGNRWQDVALALSKYNRNSVGGRMGHVGVPGLLLGGENFYPNRIIRPLDYGTEC
jgi:hypothetical protein